MSRLISVNKLEPGMILKEAVLGDNGQVLLQSGTRLVKAYIESIHELNLLTVEIFESGELSFNDYDLEAVKRRREQQSAANRIRKIMRSFFDMIHDKAFFSDQTISRFKHKLEEIPEEVLKQNEVLKYLIRLEGYDRTTLYHSGRTAILAYIVGIQLKLSIQELKELIMSALLHDVGKLRLDKTILMKKVPLTPEERSEFQKHPVFGYDLLKDDKHIPDSVKLVTLQHHELHQGQGYPLQLQGTQIHLFGRVVALCNVYDNLINKTPYRKEYSPSDAMEYFMGSGGREFDAILTELFVKAIILYPIGSVVALSNGCQGVVKENYEDIYNRPKIHVTHIHNKPLPKPFDLPLRDKKYYNITITNVL